VGWKAKDAYTSHQLLPDVTERLSANIAQSYQIKNPPPGPRTAGSLHTPMAEGAGVDDGMRALKAEERRHHRTGESQPELQAAE
jgi:hypothetical protein